MSIVLLDRPFSDDALRDPNFIDLRNINMKVWPRVLSNLRSTKVDFYHLTLSSLDGIEALSFVRELKIVWAPKISSLAPVFSMQNIRFLSISDLKNLRDIQGIEKLEGLETLELSGNLGSLSPPLCLSTINPIANLKNLKHFSLVNARIEDDDITCLAQCRLLRSLELSNQFERSQFAYLAKELNAQLETPILAFRESSLQCNTCGEDKFLFRGRRMPFLCKLCDTIKFTKLESEFNKLISSS